MGTPVEEVADTAPAEGQTEEVPQGEASGESKTESGTDEGFSINDVPLQYRSHVEKAIKPFHSRTTKAEMKAAEIDKKFKELESKSMTFEEKERQLEFLKQDAIRLITDDDYRRSLRSKYGIKDGNGAANAAPNLPEGWNNPEAVTARSLLFDEIVKSIEDKYNFKLSDLPNYGKANESVRTLLQDKAQEEIDATKKGISDEGLPWSEEILDSCIEAVGKQARSGKKISLREAYNKVVMPIVENERKKQASTDSKIKEKEKLPFKPGGRAGEPKLTGDALLRNVIDGLGLPGSYND